jgi:Na+/melibiose symporter-like transporter
VDKRWRDVGVLVGALFAVNVVARLITRLAFDGDDAAANRVSLVMFVVIGLILAAVAFFWGRRRPLAAWSADMALTVLVAMLLTVLVGPLLVGHNPFAGGAGTFFAQIWLYLLATGAGVLLGYLVLTALGLDHRSQQLKRYAEVKAAKPRRVVRR